MPPGIESAAAERPSTPATAAPPATAASPAAGSPRKARTAAWPALVVGFAVAAATLGLWQALLAQERSQTERTVALSLETVRNEISSRMDSRILALVRMARRWEMRGRPPRPEWEADANFYLSHDAGYVAIARVEPDLRVSLIMPQDAGRGLQGAELVGGRQRGALETARARGDVTLTHPFSFSTSDRAIMVNVPVFQGEAFDGFIVGVFRVQAALATILGQSIAPHHGIVVFDGGEELYRRDWGAGRSTEDWSQETGVQLGGVTWRVRVSPQEELIEQRSPLPRAALTGGLALALLLALTVRFAQVARLRARETDSANQALTRVIAEHQHAHDRLRKLSRAVEQSPTMVIISDLQGAIEYVNPKFTQVTGYAFDEVMGKNPRLLKSGETAPEEYQRLWQTITAGGEWRGVLRNKKKNGELFWVRSAISPIRDAQETVTHFLAESEDVTEHKRLEQQVTEHNREMAESEALAAMGRAASMIAHDLRNPLSSIKMGLQILSRKPAQGGTAAEQELLEISQGQVRYMEEVLSDLLSYSLPDALKPEWLSMEKLLDTALMLSQKEVVEHKVRVKTHYQPGLPLLHGDANKLRQALTNLIVNGAQAAGARESANPTLVIDARLSLGVADRPSIQVEICDNGSGIASEHADRVFEPFFTTRAQGTGLGLSIAKRIIDQHQGSIRLQPEHPGGTRVTVVLPLEAIRNRNGA
ncbi:MAG: PAS domain S-box protein [Burkholderiales bacterium]|nr:PAS domain S-box protein [Burkholderiales bacterium]